MLADFVLARPRRLFCEKYLTLPADEKVNMGPEENKTPETQSPPGQGDLHTPPQEYSMTAEGGALVPREWCIHSGEMVHGGRRRGAPSRHTGAYSGRALRLRMDSPSIWIVYAL